MYVHSGVTEVSAVARKQVTNYGSWKYRGVTIRWPYGYLGYICPLLGISCPCAWKWRNSGAFRTFTFFLFTDWGRTNNISILYSLLLTLTEHAQLQQQEFVLYHRACIEQLFPALWSYTEYVALQPKPKGTYTQICLTPTCFEMGAAWETYYVAVCYETTFFLILHFPGYTKTIVGLQLGVCISW